VGNASDPYEDIVPFYINLIRLDSPQAAAAIEQISATVGTQAALRAALIITVIRMELRQNRWIPDKGVYSYLIQDYPEATGLLEVAIGCCMQVWGIGDLKGASLNTNDFDVNAVNPSE
jgi:hypothetical protein